MAHIITDAEAQKLTRIAKSLIGPIVSHGLIRRSDMDDAVQELLLAVVRNSDLYYETASAEFLTFAHGVMQNAAFRVVRKFRSATSRILTDAISIDAVCDAEDTDDAPDYGKLGTLIRMPEGATAGEKRRQEQLLLIREVIGSMSPESQKICRLLSIGCSVSEIARRTALTRKIIRLRIESIKNALLEAGVVIRGKNN